MKNTFFTTLLTLLNLTNSFCQSDKNTVITTDIDNFWTAFDKIKTTNDTTLQLAYLNDLFIKKGTEGLALIMEARRYTPKEYLGAIHKYPLFWQSIRANTNKAKGLATEIEQGIEQLRAMYPELKPAKIYFPKPRFRWVRLSPRQVLTDKVVLRFPMPNLFHPLRI